MRVRSLLDIGYRHEIKVLSELYGVGEKYQSLARNLLDTLALAEHSIIYLSVDYSTLESASNIKPVRHQTISTIIFELNFSSISGKQWILLSEIWPRRCLHWTQKSNVSINIIPISKVRVILIHYFPSHDCKNFIN
jgi:hypothetical protein